jgi:hypothetical protein
MDHKDETDFGFIPGIKQNEKIGPPWCMAGLKNVNELSKTGVKSVSS